MKTLEDFFVDWESHVFGFGYGSGEETVLGALKTFLSQCTEGTRQNMYDYRALESTLGKRTAWLLINALCHANVIEYGTSTRYGWLDSNGIALKKFCESKTLEQLAALTSRDGNYIHCAPDYCNCDDGDCRKLNPFWPK